MSEKAVNLVKPEKSGKSGKFGSVFGFLMTAIGYAVGLGAIWRQPYLMGTNGGGAFLVIMIVLSFLVGIPLILCEMTIGRTTRTTPINSYRKLVGKNSKWQYAGWLGVAAGMLLMSYYASITGTVFHYLVLAVVKGFNGVTGAESPEIYNNLIGNAPLVFFYTALVLGFGALIISRGVQGGLEKFNKIALPLLLVAIIICAVKSLTLPAAGEALRWLFIPDFSKVTGTVLLNCLSQTFFLAGIGMASIYVFGSYLSDESSLTQSSIIMTISNIVVSILAGIAIFPAVFSYGVDPQAGSSLVFQTMPVLFGMMTGGRIFAICFFLCLFCAAYSTCLGLIEGATAALSDVFKIDRKKMVWIATGIMFVIGIVPTFVGTPVLADVRVFGLDLYTLLDYITMNVLIPIGALITVLYCGYKFAFPRFMEETNKGATIFRITNLWRVLICVVCPVVIVAISILGFKSTFLG